MSCRNFKCFKIYVTVSTYAIYDNYLVHYALDVRLACQEFLVTSDPWYSPSKVPYPDFHPCRVSNGKVVNKVSKLRINVLGKTQAYHL